MRIARFLSTHHSAVVESRRIFRKLKAYVTYRFAATIQIVIVLTLLIYISNCPINSLYIILLALLNDLTMLPIAYDNQQASVRPEAPDVAQMIQLSAMLGVLETCFTLLWAYGASHTGTLASPCSEPMASCTHVPLIMQLHFLHVSRSRPYFCFYFNSGLYPLGSNEVLNVHLLLPAFDYLTLKISTVLLALTYTPTHTQPKTRPHTHTHTLTRAITHTLTHSLAQSHTLTRAIKAYSWTISTSEPIALSRSKPASGCKCLWR